MTRISSPVLALISFLILTVPIQGQEQGANVNPLARSRRPSVTVIRQQSAPVILKVASVKSIAGKPGLVQITFKARGASAVKGYHFHYEEVFVDKDGTKGTVVTDSTSLRSLSYEESLNAHENAEIEVWVSGVEFLDGSTWESSLIPKLKQGRK
jgi:hypothetical protein